MERIKDINKAQRGDFILYKGALYVIKDIRHSELDYLISVDGKHTLEVKVGDSYTIYRQSTLRGNVLGSS